MATKKPRITITLEKRSYEVLSRLSAAGGDSMSEIVAGFVDMALPSLERLVVVLEGAKAAPQEIRAGLAAAFGRADAEVMPQLVAAVQQGDLWLEDAAKLAQRLGGATQESAPGAAPAVPTPALVTRGSGRVKTPARVPANGGEHGEA